MAADEREQERKDRILRAVPELGSLPPGTEVFVIQDGDQTILYNVTKAREFTEGRAPTAAVDIAKAAEHIQPCGDELPADDKVEVVPEWAMTRDLSRPLILLQPSEHPEGGQEGRLIDGWHRVYKAAQLGIPQLPAVVLTAEEERAIRIVPFAASA